MQIFVFESSKLEEKCSNKQFSLHNGLRLRLSSHMLMEMTQNSVFEHTSRLVLLDGQLWLEQLYSYGFSKTVSVSGAVILAL